MATEERFEQGRRRLLPVGLVDDGDGDTLAYGVDKGSGATTSLTDADGVVDVPADVNVVPTGESVTVDLFSPKVRPPSALVVGEDDPALSRLLDELDRPRLRTPGTRVGLRWLERDIPDAVVVAGDSANGTVDGGRRLGQWSREWGLVVPAGNPEDVDGLESLVDRELRFVNRPTDSGLRTTLANALASLAEQRDVDRHSVTDAIDGFDLTVRSVESPARKVAAGDADAGLGLRATAAKLDLGFVPVRTETVTVLVNAARTEKAGVQSLERVLNDGDDVFRSLPGYSRIEQ